MKFNLLLFSTLILTSQAALAFHTCTDQETKAGCHTEQVECDKPTQNICHQCVCPSSSDSLSSYFFNADFVISNETISEAVVDSLPLSLSVVLEVDSPMCCTKTFCHTYPKTGEPVCHESTVCGSLCQIR